jgi:hypothetical protein
MPASLVRVPLFFLCCHLSLTQICHSEELTDPYDQLYDIIVTRTTHDGKTYGENTAVPLLWNSSSYLLDDETHQRFVAALDRFSALSTEEINAYGNIRRALLQRHLWAVFDWSTVRRPPTFKPEPQKLKSARFTIQRKVASLMKRIALSEAEIRALPNPMKATIQSGAYPENYDAQDGHEPFLPADLFDEDGAWVCLDTSVNELPAKSHSESAEWRSAFLVFMRLPDGREATLAYMNKLNEPRDPVVLGKHGLELNPETPQFPIGTQFALVERPMLINDQGEPTLSPLVYGVQLRACMSLDFKDMDTLIYRTQAFAIFVLEPRQLFDGKPAMRAIGKDERHYETFFSGDPFDRPPNQTNDSGLRIRNCNKCHTLPGNVSFLSRNRTFPQNIPRPANLRERTPKAIGQTTAVRKRRHYTWGVLETLWRNEPQTQGR